MWLFGRSWRPSGYVWPLLAMMLIAFDVPLLGVVAYGFSAPDLSLDSYRELLTAPTYARVVGRTFRIAAFATLLCAILAYPLAYWMWSLPARARMLVAALVVVPFWISVLVRTYALTVIFGSAGVVNSALIHFHLIGNPIPFLYNEIGVMIGIVNTLLPFMVLPVFVAMIKIDGRLLQAAATLGAGEAMIFRRVFFPLTLPAVATGSILVFSMALGFFVTPAVLGGGRVPMIASTLDMLINRMPRWEMASALSIVLLAVTIALFWLSPQVGRHLPGTR